MKNLWLVASCGGQYFEITQKWHCENIGEAYEFWQDTFLGFANRYWSNNIPMRTFRSSSRSENFFFRYKKVLFIGLNLVGGAVHDTTEWTTRLKNNYLYTRKLILDFRNSLSNEGGTPRVVIFGNSNPFETSLQDSFFDALVELMDNEFDHTVPILYMNGGETGAFEMT